MSASPWMYRASAEQAGVEMARMQAEAMAREHRYRNNQAAIAAGEAAARAFQNRLSSCHAEKCSCCGSREFRHHHGRSVCAYCRSGT